MNKKNKPENTDSDFLLTPEAIRAFINASPDPVIITNESSSIIMVNELTEEIFGYSKESIIGKKIDILMPLKYREIHKNHFNNFTKNPKPRRMGEMQYPVAIDHKNNEIPVDISINHLTLSNQNIYICTIRDMTSQIIKNNKIAENEKWFSSLVKSIPGAVYRLEKNENWDIGFLSQQIQEITGYDKNEFHIKDSLLYEIVHDDDKEKVLNEVKKSIDSNQTFSIKYRIKHKNGNIRWVLENGRVSFENNETKWIDGVILDITESQHMADKFSYHVTHDELTDLVNRREFEKNLKDIIEETKLKKSGPHALFYLDLDQFKIINDTCGHTAGDLLLKSITDILKTKIRKRDVLARLGSDEFGILMEDCTLEQATRIAESIQKEIREYSFKWKNDFLKISTSIGIVEINDNDVSHERILMNVDTACHTAKDAGGDSIYIYQDNDTEVSRKFSEMEWVNRINLALENDDFYLSFQKIIEVQPKTEKMHFEVLIRLLQNGIKITPNEFLPSAEKYNLSAKIDTWVFNQVIKYLSNNHDFLDKLELCSINLSGNSLGNLELLNNIVSTFKNTSFPSEKICFEITETAVIRNLGKANDMIQAIRNIGCKFALDDFGSGLSSFAYLRSLDIDYLKFDGLFIKNIDTDPINYSIIKSINEIAKVMNIETCAEFIENKKSLEKIKKIGITYAQGFHIEKPIDIHNIDDVNNYLKNYF